MKPSRGPSGFTLLELVVVLAILAITTGLAVRALDRVDDQRRFENAQRGLQELSEAVLGAPDERNLDGTRTISGFVADMGRLPRTTAEGDVLTLRELWGSPDLPYQYNVRQAVETNGVAAEDKDEEVWVPGGWRGPYLRLPIGAETLLDAWGNPMISPDTASPPDPLATGYHRLRDAADNPITTPGEEIRIIRHLGANGREDELDTGYDREQELRFVEGDFQAGLMGQVEVLAGNSAAVPFASDQIIVRVFGPDPADPRKIRVVSSEAVGFTSNPVKFEILKTAGVTIGPRIVRAYFKPANGVSTTSYTKSAVKHLTLRPGMNFLQLTIDR